MQKTDHLFVLLARYNQAANEAYTELLDEHQDLVTAQTGDWFGSILKLLTHVFLSDVVWLRRTKPSDPDAEPPFHEQFGGVFEPVFEGWSSFRTNRRDLDEFIVRRCEAYGDDDWREPVSYGNSGGKQFSQPRGHLFLHMFNHQTHHRGQLAEIFDQRGIENNASNLVSYLRDGLLEDPPLR